MDSCEHISKPFKIRRLFIREKPLVQLHVISWRNWGQPKLKTLDILKGHKPDFKIHWNKKLDFSAYVVNYDVYVFFHDWYSRGYKPSNPCAYTVHQQIADWNENMVKHGVDPIDQKKFKFIYPDGFGSIVLRGDAWLLYKNLVRDCDRSRNTWFGTVEQKLIYCHEQWELENNMGDGNLTPDMYRYINNLCYCTKNFCNKC